MSTFSKIVAGPRKRAPATLPLPGASWNAELGKWEGPTAELDVRALRPDEFATVLAGARQYAIDHGLKEPVPSDELFERGRMLHTLALACVDREAPKDDPDPSKFFDGGVPQIEGSDLITPETVAYLFAVQALHQDEVSPLQKNQTPEQFVTAVAKIVEGDVDFFASMRPGMQWSFVRILASRYVNSTPHELPSSPSSETPATTTES